MLVYILVLNYNGRQLLAECLPSILLAAEASRHDCKVVVIDNSSTDDSISWLSQSFPEVQIVRSLNRGLCSFNEVVPTLDGDFALLLNNDIKLGQLSIDPLIVELEQNPLCFMAAPLCWRFDGRTYEGFRTAIRWHWGIVQATALFPEHERKIFEPSLTASVGAAMAVDCRKFEELGGFDPLYLPGRLEDVDLSFRAYMSGYHIQYVPESVVYHRGMATFGPVLGSEECDLLALRNTLLFQWKNIRHPKHVLRELFWLPVRMLFDIFRSLHIHNRRRFEFTTALCRALLQVPNLFRTKFRSRSNISRERKYFVHFHPDRMRRSVLTEPSPKSAALFKQTVSKTVKSGYLETYT